MTTPLFVFGHPRSGLHYTAHLLRHNSLGNWTNHKFRQWASAHRWPPPFTNEATLGQVFTEKGNRVFYVWRDFEDVAASIIAAAANRMQYGLSVDALKSDTYEELIKSEHLDKRFLNKWALPDQLHMTPYEAWKEHVDSWLSFAENRSDIVYPVKYEELREDFQGTMLGMANWLGLERERGSFENFTKKADKSPVREGGYKPPKE